MSPFKVDTEIKRGIILKKEVKMEKIKKNIWIVALFLVLIGGYAVLKAEWTSDNSIFSDSYTLRKIEEHLQDISETLDKMVEVLEEIKESIERE